MKYIKEVEDLETSSLSTLGKTIEDAPISSSPRIEPDELYLRSPTLKTKEDLAIQAQKERNIIKQLLKIQNNPPPCPAPTKGKRNLNLSHIPVDICFSPQARYLIEAKWWTAWKEFVNFDSNEFESIKLFFETI